METLKKSREFKRVLEGGSREKLENIVICALPNPGGPPRVGISVTKRARGSVKRNRIKRRIREAVRRCASLLPPGVDMVIIAGERCLDSDFSSIERDIRIFAERWKKEEHRQEEGC
ncbi:MAG: ribonuclease P protein component [Actinobacteria bacterium]|nr:ribonuclease P protein component [Actinomycetota bacterium]